MSTNCCTPFPGFCAPENIGLIFPSLIGPMGPPGGPGLYVNSLAELRLLDATVWPQGYQAVVGGYAAVNDGGGGTFVYVPTATDDDNNGTIISPSNSIGRWFRIYSGAVSVKWFGAKGDGTTNDYQAIQNAITYIESLAVGGGVFIPAGVYLIETAITISGAQSFVLFGEGWGSVLKTSGVINCIEMGDGSIDQTVLLRLMNFQIDCDDDGEIGVSNSRLHQTVVSGIYITGTTVAAIDMNMAYDNVISNCTIINNNARGIIVDENNENTRIYDCRFELNTGIAVHFRNGSCSGSKVTNNQFIANGVGLQVDCGTAEDAEAFGVSGNYFKDQIGANALFGTDAGTRWIVSLKFDNNEIKTGSNGTSTCNVTFGRCKRPVITSNVFGSCDVITTDCENLVEFGNSFTGGSALPTQIQLGNSDGNIQMTELPTSDPAVAGDVWSDSNVLTVSP